MPAFCAQRVSDKCTWYSSGHPGRVFLVPDLFDVLAEPTRRDILGVLREKVGSASEEMSVGELVETLGITQPTVSKHLKVLRENGLVHVREDGQHRYYRLAPEALAEVRDWLERLSPSGAERPLPTFDFPYVDLWPAGYQVGLFLGSLRRQVTELLARAR